MNDAPGRLARKQETSGPERIAAPRGDGSATRGHRAAPRGLRLRISLAVAATVVAVLGAVPFAQAATGGASGFEPAPEAAPAPTTESAPTASSGAELAFGPTRWAGASWYGPGLWGRSTACGQVLRPTTIGVAHKTLPCGTTVRFTYQGRSVVAPVIDRGPYIRGRAWDLTAAAAAALEFESTGVGVVRYQVATTYARP